MSDVRRIVDTYLAAWNEQDGQARAQLIQQAWTREGRYVDPMLAAEGHAAISEMVAAVHSKFPGHVFRRTSGIDAHNGQVRFGWELAAPDGAITVAGLDVGELGADGRLTRITGFFGALPEKTAA
jgi:SnoaL-like domain